MARTDERVTGNHAYALAIRHHQAGQLTEAERLYRDVLAADPKHLGALQYLGIIGLQSGRPALAVESIGKALALNDAMPEYHYHLGYALYQLHQLDDAVAHYQRAIALTPNYADAHLHLGNVLSEQGRFVEATACYEQVIALNPSADAHYNFANLLASQGRLHEAAEHHRRALALMPDHAEAHHGLGLIALAQGKFEDARTCFERALALNPGMVAAYNNLARAFWARGHADQALGVLRRALAVQETPETKKLFVQCAKSLGFVPNVDDFRNSGGPGADGALVPNQRYRRHCDQLDRSRPHAAAIHQPRHERLARPLAGARPAWSCRHHRVVAKPTASMPARIRAGHKRRARAFPHRAEMRRTRTGGGW